MTFYVNGIRYDENSFLTFIYNAGATISDIRDMLDGFDFLGDDGNYYSIDEG